MNFFKSRIFATKCTYRVSISCLIFDMVTVLLLSCQPHSSHLQGFITSMSCHVCLYAIFLYKPFTTYITFTRFYHQYVLINLVNVMYVVKGLYRKIAYRHTWEDILVIKPCKCDVCGNHIYKVLSPVCLLMCICKLFFCINPLPHTSHLQGFITSMSSHVCL
jgi:hypothetical protein